MLEFKKQDSLLLESMEQVILFMRKVEKEKIDSNHKGIVVEKFLEFLFQIFSLYLRLKAAKAIQVTKEEAEIMCQSCHFMIKQGSLNTLIDCSLKFFYDLISFTNYPSNSEQQNFFYNEIFKNWNSRIILVIVNNRIFFIMKYSKIGKSILISNYTSKINMAQKQKSIRFFIILSAFIITALEITRIISLYLKV